MKIKSEYPKAVQVKNATQSDAFRIQRELDVPRATPLALVSRQMMAAIIGGKSTPSKINSLVGNAGPHGWFTSIIPAILSRSVRAF
jgi:hypothetical protein